MDYGYARVSTGDQNLDLQRDAFKRFGLDPDDPKQVIEEKRSGAKDRPKFNALLGQLQPGDSLSVWKLDRLGRTVVEVITTARNLLERGITVRILKDGLILDASSAWGKFQLTLLGGVAELERDLIIERTRDGKQAARARGKYPGGARLYGWTSKPDEDGTFHVIDAEATIIEEMARRVLKPESLSAITRDLKTRNVPASTGGGWKPSTIRSLLTNPRTAGIIGAETHRDLLRLFADTKERRRQGRPSRYLLTGIIRCECGARMYINLQAAGEGRPRYRCLHSLDINRCRKVSILAAPLEKYITEQTIRWLASPALAKVRQQLLEQDHNLAALQAQIAADVEELEELARLRAARRIRIEEWLPQRDIIEARIAMAEAELRKVPLVGVLKDLPTTRAELETAWASWDMERKRSILKASIARLVIHQTTKRGAGIDEDRVELEFTSHRPTSPFTPEKLEQMAKGAARIGRTEAIECAAVGNIRITAKVTPVASGFWPNYANEEDNGPLLHQVARDMDQRST